MIQQVIANFAEWLPFGYAFGAGTVAAVNPCGFLMLPSYVAFYLGISEAGQRPHRAKTLARALSLAFSVTLGFGVLFSLIGLAVSVAGRGMAAFFPAAGLVVGIALAGLGVWLLITRRSLGIAAAARTPVTFRKSLGGAFIFGIGYGLASLSCTLPIFLVVVGSALAAQSPTLAIFQFLSYSLGMGFLLAVVIAGTAIFKGALDRHVRRVMPYVHEISAVFLVGAGAYLIYYWIRYGALF